MGDTEQTQALALQDWEGRAIHKVFRDWGKKRQDRRRAEGAATRSHTVVLGLVPGGPGPCVLFPPVLFARETTTVKFSGASETETGDWL